METLTNKRISTMKKSIKSYSSCFIAVTDDDVQEYINTIYSFMHNKDKIKLANIENFYLATKFRNENDKLLTIIDILIEFAFLNGSERFK